jgi:cell division protease FtsH
MVYDYAMGTQIRSHQLPADDVNTSEALRRTRDEEVQAIAEEAYRGAHRLLMDHRHLLDDIGQRLLDNEVIERDEIQELMDSVGDPAPRPTPLPRIELLPHAGDRAGAIASEPPPDVS